MQIIDTFSPIKPYAITIYPFIISEDDLDEVTLNHEKIHIQQQKELFVIPFYILYAYFYFKNIRKGMSKDDAYLYIPFESEAYENEFSMSYLSRRPKMAWTKYI